MLAESFWSEADINLVTSEAKEGALGCSVFTLPEQHFGVHATQHWAV